MVEYGEDNTYSCYSETAIGDYALIDGDGNTVAEAKAPQFGISSSSFSSKKFQ